jgi:hypothetical protein
MFENHLKDENRNYVIFWKANDGSNNITTEVRKPDASIEYFQGNDIQKYLEQPDQKNAVYTYVGDWKDSEKKIHPNYKEEYRKWAISKGWIK